MVNISMLQIKDISKGYTRYLLRCGADDRERGNDSIIVDGVCGEKMQHIPESIKDRIMINRNWVLKLQSNKLEANCLGIIIDFDDQMDDKGVYATYKIIKDNLDLSETEFSLLCSVYHGYQIMDEDDLKMKIRTPHYHIVICNKYAAGTKRFINDASIIMQRYG